jgi:hypothetical protein
MMQCAWYAESAAGVKQAAAAAASAAFILLMLWLCRCN